MNQSAPAPALEAVPPPVDAPPAEVPVLTLPADGVPDVVADPHALTAAIRRLAAGSGPIALDTERAQGFRYTNRAYLVQLRRAGAGTVLIDPVPLVAAGGPGLGDLRDALDDEWIIHAASQDLPCLAEIGLLPERLFDTELAARLLGYPRVALGTLTESLLGVRLLKEHSAADWSRRPLPPEWLAYAALDVELLGELRHRLAEEVREQRKDERAARAFAALGTLANSAPAGRQVATIAALRSDSLRPGRTSAIHHVRSPRGRAVGRELWLTRDEIAARLDKAPGRILGDEAMTQLAAPLRTHPVTVDRSTLRAIERFNRREARRFESSWLSAVERAAALPRSALPPVTTESDGPPTLRSWARRSPAAAARWESVRPAVNEVATRVGLPAENLVSPDALRRVLWEPAGADPDALDAQLAGFGVREWQRGLILDVVVSGVRDAQGTGR